MVAPNEVIIFWVDLIQLLSNGHGPLKIAGGDELLFAVLQNLTHKDQTTWIGWIKFAVGLRQSNGVIVLIHRGKQIDELEHGFRIDRAEGNRLAIGEMRFTLVALS